MDSVPPELIFRIFEQLPISSLVALATVCKVWKSIAADILYTNIEHHAWKPKRVSLCLNALSCNNGGSLSTIVRHLHLSLWSTDPAFSHLLLDALLQTKRVTKLKLSMSETFSNHFEENLLQRGIIAYSSIGEGQPELWTKQFLPQLEELQLSHGHKPFQLAAGRPVRTVSSMTHIDHQALLHLLPFLQRSHGPVQSVHFHLTARDTNVASKVLNLTAIKLPRLTHAFFNFFVSKRSHPPKYTPDLLEDLSTLSSLQTVELILSRHARSPDPYLYSHCAAVHTLKATAFALTHVVIDTIQWRHRSIEETDGNETGWSPLPTDPRTHAWWLSQYGDPVVAHVAMLQLWKDVVWSIPLPHEIVHNCSSYSHSHSRSISQMSIDEL